MKTVIVFDDDELSTNIYKVDNSIDMKNYDCIITNKNNEGLQLRVDQMFDLTLLNKDKIDLDPTTMEKIKRYNIEVDKNSYEKQIKTLKTQYTKQLKKLDKLKAAIKYFESNVMSFVDSNNYDADEFEEYVYDKYDKYDDYDDII